ncbi:MAG: hypothetical protein ALAOOOJD_01464 [bacterium]|nr:hypothetical protein [bacterium]
MILFGAGKIERDKLEGQVFVFVGQFKFTGCRNIAGNHLVEFFKSGDDDGRNVFIVFDAIRAKGIKAVDAAKEHFTVFIFMISAGIEFVALQAIQRVVILKSFGFGVETRQAFVGAEPKIAVIIFQDSINCFVGQAVFLPKARKFAGLAVEAIQPAAPRSEPQHAAVVRIFVD